MSSIRSSNQLQTVGTIRVRLHCNGNSKFFIILISSWNGFYAQLWWQQQWKIWVSWQQVAVFTLWRQWKTENIDLICHYRCFVNKPLQIKGINWSVFVWEFVNMCPRWHPRKKTLMISKTKATRLIYIFSVWLWVLQCDCNRVIALYTWASSEE